MDATGRETLAVVLEGPETLRLQTLALNEPGPEDVVVDVRWSAISGGTERLLWSGRMPPFPGMGYPLVPGYETVGTVIAAGPQSGRAVGDAVFVPGANCYGRVRGLFGGAAKTLVTSGQRVQPLQDLRRDQAVLLALAATAEHALVIADQLPELIVGHGVLGRLLARLAVLRGGNPVVWERDPSRRDGAFPYAVIAPEADDRSGLSTIIDVSGDPHILDALIAKLAPRGSLVLAGFYAEPISFAFPPAFMREAQLKIAAQWQPADLAAVTARAASGELDLDGLITHRAPADAAADAYRTAFDDPTCLKMILDWGGSA